MVKQKAKLKQKKAEPKRPEKTRMAILKCATKKKFWHSCMDEKYRRILNNNTQSVE